MRKEKQLPLASNPNNVKPVKYPAEMSGRSVTAGTYHPDATPLTYELTSKMMEDYLTSLRKGISVDPRVRNGMLKRIRKIVSKKLMSAKGYIKKSTNDQKKRLVHENNAALLIKLLEDLATF
jgi:hypothetical protein